VKRLSDHWNRTPGKKYTVYTYTNAPEVELLVNGKSLGTKKNSLDPDHRNKIVWDSVAYAPGYIEAVAKRDGKVIARHRIDTFGKAVKLTLSADPEVWHADGQDLQFVQVNAVDAKGNRVWTANEEMDFSVQGNARIVGVSNGDITTDENLAGSHIRLYNGTAQVILRAGRNPGKVLLKVSGGGFKDKSIKILLR
jgi:beta-galactosidase